MKHRPPTWGLKFLYGNQKKKKESGDYFFYKSGKTPSTSYDTLYFKAHFWVFKKEQHNNPGSGIFFCQLAHNDTIDWLRSHLCRVLTCIILGIVV